MTLAANSKVFLQFTTIHEKKILARAIEIKTKKLGVTTYFSETIRVRSIDPIPEQEYITMISRNPSQEVFGVTGIQNGVLIIVY